MKPTPIPAPKVKRPKARVRFLNRGEIHKPYFTHKDRYQGRDIAEGLDFFWAKRGLRTP